MAVAHRVSFGSRQAPLWAGLLTLLLLASALAVVHASHACRELHTELQRLEVEQWALQEDYGRLLLEQSTWASHYRVERTATGELDMQAPAPGSVRVVRP
ncbi:cell division protein FtsL [Haliea atlantica]|jgi:cell division protein FtsL